MSKVLAISTNKGGVLKTSLTTNLAGVLSKNNKVLIIDTDNQGNVSLSFGINPDQIERTLYDVLVDGIDVKSTIIPAHQSENGKVDILPSNDDMAFFEFDVLTVPNRFPQPFSMLKKSMAPVLNEYDYILIDTPPNLGLTQGNVLAFAEQILVPFQPESYSMRSLVKILKAISDFKTKQNPELSVLGIVATLVDQRTTLHSEVLQEARKFCMNENIHMFETVIPRSIRYASSVAYDRLPATLSAKNNQLVAAYHELIKEVEQLG